MTYTKSNTPPDFFVPTLALPNFSNVSAEAAHNMLGDSVQKIIIFRLNWL
jgi:hypothetical protein